MLNLNDIRPTSSSPRNITPNPRMTTTALRRDSTPEAPEMADGEDILPRQTTPTPGEKQRASRFYETTRSNDPQVDDDLGRLAAGVVVSGHDCEALMPNNNNRRRPHPARRSSQPQPQQQQQQQQQSPSQQLPPQQPHLPSVSVQAPPPYTYSTSVSTDSYYPQHTPGPFLGGQYTPISHQQAQTYSPPYPTYAYDPNTRSYIPTFAYPQDQRQQYVAYSVPSPPPAPGSSSGPSSPAQSQRPYGLQTTPPYPSPAQPSAYNNTGSPGYVGSSSPPSSYPGTAYQSMRFSPSITHHHPSNTYGYGSPPNTHSFQSPPHPSTMYTPPHTHPQYAGYSPGQDGGQGTWWYMPHAQQSYEADHSAYYQQQYAQQQQQSQSQSQSIPSHHVTAPSQQAIPSRDPDVPDTFSTQTRLLASSSPAYASGSSGHPSPRPAVTPISPSSLHHRPSPAPAPPPSLHPLPSRLDRHRRPHHPNPPAYRSEWVMWVGNVPSDATHDELWRFFTRPPSSASSSPPTSSTPSIVVVPSSSSSSLSAVASPSASGPSTHPTTPSSEPAGTSSMQLLPVPPTNPPNGVLSIFLISRSSCAFVNLASEAHLQAAIDRFHNTNLRPRDTRVPRLVCRVRRKEDDMKAGVGGQRGTGLHAKWVKDHVKDQQDKGKKPASGSARSARDGQDPSQSSPSDTFSDSVARLSISSEAGSSMEGGVDTSMDSSTKGGGTLGSGSSGSYASTNSSFLVKYFPKRYFILKSLTQYDLDLSVEKGLWATQKHNEGILDKAYRTSQEVYLIFGVNKSGEFYGYAKMAGQIHKGEERVSWASRPPDTLSPRSSVSSPLAGRVTPNDEGQSTTGSVSLSPGHFFSPSSSRIVMDSPSPVIHSGSDYHSSHAPNYSLQHQATRKLHTQNQLQRQRDHATLSPLGSVPTPSLSTHGASIETTSTEPRRPALPAADSAPAALGPHKQLTVSTLGSGQSLDHWAGRSRAINSMDPSGGSIELRLPEPGQRAFSDKEREENARQENPDEDDDGDNIEPWTSATRSSKSLLKPVSEEDERSPPEGSSLAQHPEIAQAASAALEGPGGSKSDAEWGESFRIEWIQTTRLPFHRTKHLRNPWNHDREIKVSRDGTELEPSVGQALLEEWDRDVEGEEATASGEGAGSGEASDSVGGGGGGRGGASSLSLRP